MSEDREVREVAWPHPPTDHLMHIYRGYWSALALQPACELAIFDKLETTRGISAEQLAEAQSWDVGNTARLLDMLTAMDLVKKDFDPTGTAIYANTPSGQYLRSDQPGSYSSLFTKFTKILMQVIPGMADKVRSGTQSDAPHSGQTEGEKSNKGDHGHGHGHSHGHGHGHSHDQPSGDQAKAGGNKDKGNSKFMYDIMEANTLPYIEKIIKAYDLSKYKRVIDVGGGIGRMGCTLSREYPDMKVTVVEMASVIAIAKEHFLPPDFDKLNVDFMEGNCFDIELPSADLFIVCKVMHHFSDSEVSKFLNIVYSKLPTGGSLMILEDTLNQKKDGPLTPHLFDIFMASKSIGANHSFEEYATLLEQNRFTKIQCTKSNEECMYDIILATKL